MKKILFFLSLSFLPAALNAQTIVDARAAAIGSTVTFSGVSLNGAELQSIRYIQQDNVAIAIYGSAVNSVNRGDSVSVTGTLTNYNNLLEVTPVTTLNTHGNVALPAMQMITNVNQITDTLEGELVRIDNCVFADAGTVFTGNTNYTVTGANGSFDVRIMNGSPIVGTVIPSGSISLRGIMSQYCYDPTSGCTSGYQLLPRDLSDLASESSITLISPLTAANISQNSFDLNWTTNLGGDVSYVKYGLTDAFGLSQNASNAATHVATLSGLQPGTIYYAKAYSVNGDDTVSTNIGAFATQSLSSGKITTYFNRPVDNSLALTDNNAITLTSLVDDTLAAYINRADSTLDIAIYNWDHLGGGVTIVDAINAAFQRGVKIRIIHDGSSYNAAIDYINPGIHHLSTPQGADYTIMHNKFVIIDANHADPNQSFVWTGSTNFTYQQLAIDANNVIIVQDQSLAKGYKLEFDEMWGNPDENSQPDIVAGKFGQFKTDNTPHLYNIGGVKVESFFSPSDQVNSVILRTLNTADNDIHYAVMAFTRSDLANAIKNKIQLEGIPAKGIENDSDESYTSFNILSPVMNSNLIDYPFDWIMHHKYVIIDDADNTSDPLVLTGSHNWSTAADQNNDENTLIVHDLNIANRYRQDFEGRWCESTNQNCALSLEEAESPSGDLVVYPNPATSDFYVILPGQKSGTISILNSTGIVIVQKIVDPSNGNPIFSLGEKASGVYMVSFTTEDGVYTTRLVLQ